MRIMTTLIPLVATLFLVSCGSSDGGSVSVNTTNSSNNPTTNDDDSTPVVSTVTISFSGIAVDGYISGAFACVDTNVNGRCDSSEPTTRTLADGTFSFSDVKISGDSLLPVIVSGGIDTATGKSFSGELKNIVDTASIQAGESLTVSPLTDLSAVLFLNSSTKDIQTLETSKQSVATAYGLTKAEVSSDPMTNPKVFAKSMELQQTKTLIEATLPQSSTLTQNEIQNAVKDAIAKQLDTTGNVDTTQVISKIETTLNVAIADNKKIFVKEQTKVFKAKFDELATEVSLSADTLNSFQIEIEKVQEEAVAKVIDSTDTTAITVVRVDSVDDVTSDNTLAYPPSVPTL